MDKALFSRNAARTFQDHPVFKGVRISKIVTRAEGESIGVSILEIAPKAEIGLHTHDAALDSIYVLDGKGEAYVNGEWRGITAGDYILVPEKAEHGIRNTGSAALVLFVAHAPPLF